MNKNRKTIKMPVRYLMNAVLVALLLGVILGGAVLALAALHGAEINVRVNTRLMQDRERAAALDAKAHALVDKYARQAGKIYDDVYGRLAR